MFLNRIVAQTVQDLEQRKQEQPLEEMQRAALAQPQPRDLLEALAPHFHAPSSAQAGSLPDRRTARVHLIAEVKRASPSKGMLAPHLDPVELACLYEAHGASAISVLTEQHFFLGSPEYLRAIKAAVGIPVLRKDFIVDPYQVYEARAWGADAILLICAILDDTQLRSLLQVARSLRMRCLVEVHSEEEARRAVEAGAVIIGVNSRDLTTFEMNPDLLRELRQLIPADRVVVAESGIHTAADARRLARYDVQAMLVGESLVVSNNVPEQMRALLQGANQSTQIKICGLRSPEHIDAAVEAGADMLGFIFYEPSHRYIQPEQVKTLLESTKSLLHPPKGRARPDLVGVFVNKDADFINNTVEQVGLHVVQLHGTELPEFCQQIQRPVIKALPLKGVEDLEQVQRYRPVSWRLLCDTPTPGWGGAGQTHDWELARAAAQAAPIFLAGGLTAENVAQALQQVRPWGVDVSSGVETDKQKDIQKIHTFVKQVRTQETLS